jgi:hypothetical protein
LFTAFCSTVVFWFLSVGSNKINGVMKRNNSVFGKVVMVHLMVQVVVLFLVFTPAYAGVGLYGKQQSSGSSAQTDETRRSLLSSSEGSIGLFDNTSQAALTSVPGGIEDGNGSHVPVTDGFALMLLMAGGYVLVRRFSAVCAESFSWE